MKKKITFKHILKNLDAVITGATLVACVIIVNLNVIMRYLRLRLPQACPPRC